MRIPLLVFLSASAALAQNSVADRGAPWPTSVDMPRATAMGGAHAAIATGNDALTVNPAGMAQGHKYHFELDGVYDASFPAQAVMASLVDTISTPVASGLLFSRWASGQPDGRGEGWLLGFGYASPVGQNVFFGGTTKYLRFHTPDGLVAKWAQDVGILSRKGSFAWAAVIQNLSLEKQLPLFPVTATAAVAWGTDADWHLAFDYKADLSDLSNVKHRTSFGGEILFDQSFALRGGGTWDPGSDKKFWLSAGAAVLTELGAVQFVWRKQLRGGEDQFFEAGIIVFLQ